MIPVVLVHGIWMPGWELKPLAHALRRAGFQPHLFRYPSVTGSIDENLCRLHDFLTPLAGRPLHLVAHSLGGLVGLKTLQRWPLEPTGRIVCLGSPLAGSWLARRLDRSTASRWLLGGARPLLLNGITRLPEGWKIGMITGHRPIGIGRLFRAMPTPNDGTVTQDDTQYPGLTRRIDLPVNHFGLLFDRNTRRQVIQFLSQGRFDESNR